MVHNNSINKYMTDNQVWRCLKFIKTIKIILSLLLSENKKSWLISPI